MTSIHVVESSDRLSHPRHPPDPFLEAKLHPPPSRAGWVRRDRLVDQLERALKHPVTLLAAPAGYGKTALVAQWLAGDHRPPAAWVSLDHGDNDPHRLWALVVAALERAGCQLPAHPSAHFLETDGGGTTRALLLAVVTSLARVPEDFVLILDNFHVVREPACHEQVQLLIENLPAQAHVVILTRADPGLGLGGLRASGRLVEIRAGDLSFTTEEAAALLTQGGVQVPPDAVSELRERAEGWPAALHLATLSLAGRTNPQDFVRQLSGGNRFLGDYLTEEVLSRYAEEVRDFILAVSILDRLSAPLCDHVAGISTSATLLGDLERTNLFLVPLDEERRWFRLDHLFATVARNKLEIIRPDRVQSVHARAAEWFRDHGHLDEALQHSVAAGNTVPARGAKAFGTSPVCATSENGTTGPSL